MTEIDSHSNEKATRTRPRTAARREELVRIAYRLIAEKGLEGFRTRDVASAAGIDTGTLHYHFPSKEALIQAVVAHLLADFQIVRAEAGPKPEDALDELRNEIRDAALRVKKAPDQIRVMFDLRVRTSRDPVIAAILAKVDEAWHQSMTALFNRGIKQGLFRSDIQPEKAALMLRTEVAGMGYVGLAAPEKIDEIAAAILAQMETWLSQPSM